MNIIEQKLQALREEYKTADATRRRQIEEDAERVKKSAHKFPPVIISMKEFRKPTSSQMLKQDIEDTLL